MSEKIRNAASEEQVKESSKKAKDFRRQELDDVKKLLTQKEGRRFLWRYLSLCGVFRTSWEPSARIHFNEGMRNVGLELLNDITEADPEAYIQMMIESKVGEKSNE